MAGLIEGVAIAVVVLVVLEATTWLVVLRCRRGFPWLITARDIEPAIDRDVVQKYARISFDADLGWCRKPGTSGVDTSPEGDASFSIDQHGARKNPEFDDAEPYVAVYGDSYAFCRLVDDHETWPHRLSVLLERNVGNFGVGNYGLDQALLRYEREAEDLAARVVILAVVPETVARVHSYWKHYFEYGNTLAFKPMFTLNGDGLEHLAPAVSRAEDIVEPARWRDNVRRHDRFYKEKFLPDVIRFPAIVSILRRFRRHGRILVILLRGALFGHPQHARRRAFGVVLDENHKHQRRLFADSDATKLLTLIAQRFSDVCKAHGAIPRIVVIPQPRDVRDYRDQRCAHESFLRGLSDVVPVLDLTATLTREGERMAIYKEGDLGPHTSAAANDVIASEIYRWLDRDGLLPAQASGS